MLNVERFEWSGPKVGLTVALISGIVSLATWRVGEPSLGWVALLPICWAWCRPLWAFVGALTYMLIGVWPIEPAVLTFFPAWPGWMADAVWVADAALLALPWVVPAYFRSKGGAWAASSCVAIAVLTTVPPIGIQAWCHPLLATGWLVPGSSYAGVLGLLILWWIGAWHAPWPRLTALLLLIVAAGLAEVGHKEAAETASSKRIVTIDTQVMTPKDFQALSVHVQHIKQHLLKSNYPVGTLVVLPETTLAEWRVGTQAMIEFALRDEASKTPLLMGVVFAEGGVRWNGALLYDGKTYRLMRSRQPLLLGMWQPWGDYNSHHAADWTEDLKIDHDGIRFALRICAEEFTLFWSLMDFWTNPPEALVGIGNTWWAVSPLQEATHRAHAVAIAKLMGVPLRRSINHGQALPPDPRVPEAFRTSR